MRALRIIYPALLLMAFAVAALLPGQALAEGNSLLPSIAKGKGDKCVLPTEFMRRNHMVVLDHHRDDTVIEGIRTKKLSLKGCISCHAVKGADGKAVTVKDPKHFCASCHQYAAVKVDCFECHASRPGEKEQLGGLEGNTHKRSVAALEKYLEGQEK